MKKKIKICLISSSRAEFGIMRNFINKLYNIKSIKVDLFLTGGHLSKKFGNSIKEVKENKLKYFKKIKIPTLTKNTKNISDSSSILLKKLSDNFYRNKYDLLILYGDRFEILIAAYSATLFRIPIVHLSGGDVTLGSYDNQFRNAITKIAHIHFPTNELSKKRIIQMGENPKYVFNYGSLSSETMSYMKFISKQSLEKKFNFKFKDKNFIVTIHPETLGNINKKKIKLIFQVFKKFQDVLFIFTSSNQDENGDLINSEIKKFVKKNKNMVFIKSFGQENYFSILKIVDGVIGNSSSGIHEAPSFRIGTLNLGARQAGRLSLNSIIDSDFIAYKIEKGIKKILSKKFKKDILKIKNPYFKKNTSSLIIKKILILIKNKERLLKKNFFKKN